MPRHRADQLGCARKIPAGEHAVFIADVLDLYQRLGEGSATDAAVFRFYQMRIGLRAREAPTASPGTSHGSRKVGTVA